MFRAIIKNAGLEDQSTIFILEICFSYQEIQVSRPSVNSVTQSTISMRNGLPLHPSVKQRDTRDALQRGRRRGAGGGGAGCSRRRSRARGRSESSAEEHSPAESFGPQTKGPVPTGGAIGAGEALGRTEEAAAEPSAPGQHGGRDTKSRSLNCCSHRAEEQGAQLSQPRCLHGTLPATEGGETPTTPGVRGAQPALGWMATVDLNTVNVNNNHHFRDRCLKIQDFSNSGITEWLATL